MRHVIPVWMIRLAAVLCLLTVGIAEAPAGTTVTNAALIEDTFVDSVSSGSALGGGGTFRVRSATGASAVTRATFLQFDLPLVNPGTTCTASALSLSYLDSYGVKATNQLGYVPSNPNLAALTWVNSVSSGLITGTNSDSTVNWGAGVSLFAESMIQDGRNASPAPTQYQWMVYRDLTPQDGLTQYLNSQLSATSSVRVTLAIGPKYSGMLCDWISKNRSSGGPPAFSTLELTLEKPARGALLLVR